MPIDPLDARILRHRFGPAVGTDGLPKPPGHCAWRENSDNWVEPTLYDAPIDLRRKVVAALNQCAWAVNSPGRAFRSVRVGGVLYVERRNFCADCGYGVWLNFMLRDEAWKSVAEERDLLCYQCVEKRLGRHITKDDLSKAKVNRELAHILGKIEWVAE